MKRLLILFLTAGLFAGAAQAQQRSGTGIGAIVGEPTGFTVKHWVDDRSALDAAVGWSFEGRDSFHLHADWLWHDFSIFPVERGMLPLYYGVGGRFKARSGSDDRFGVRVPVGVAYHFDNMPLELFGEIVPILDVAPSTDLSLNAAIGARWYFE